MDKILYSPKEGTTGFWGLRDVKMAPRYPSANQDMITNGRCWDRYEKEVQEYNAALESCKEKKLEIVNIHDHRAVLRLSHDGIDYFIGEEKHGTVTIPTKKLRDGDLFDLPIGFEFKPDKKCQHNGIHNSTCIYHEVLRLVKTETKENITAKQTDIEWLSELLSNFDSAPLSQDQCVTLIMKRFEVPQPEPEESQTLYTIDEVKEILHNYHCDMFKWPLEKVFPEPNWKTEWIDKNLIQRKKQ